ncbi:MAG: hypothetical protein WA210_14375 [Burkholderiaceae bacterium]
MLALEPRPAKLRRPSIQPADDTDAPAIRALLVGRYPYLADCDWTKVAGWWLVAVLDDRIVGTVQLAGSLPIGRLEYLTIDEHLPKRDQAKVAHKLMWSACGTLQRMGCSMVQGIVGFDVEGWAETLTRRGGVVVVSGRMVARRLR